MLFKLSNPNSNLALTLGYLNPALNNSALSTYCTCIAVVLFTMDKIHVHVITITGSVTVKME